jgi:hypothetical protein
MASVCGSHRAMNLRAFTISFGLEKILRSSTTWMLGKSSTQWMRPTYLTVRVFAIATQLRRFSLGCFKQLHNFRQFPDMI